jgi:hypothetical protein
MRLNVFAAMFAILLWGTAPAFAGPPPDVDGDGVADYEDNCIDADTGANPAQDDTDADDCGNVCDADYDQSGQVLIPDLLVWLPAFTTVSALHDHTEPVGVGPVLIPDLLRFLAMYTMAPGPSGTTVSTLACP